MNDANPRWQHAEGGPDDERDPYPQEPYYQQQPYGYDAYGQPVQQPASPPQQTYADPYYADPSQTYGGGEQQHQQGWIPQQPQPPQQPYYDQAQQQAPQGYDTGQQPVYDTGQFAPVYDTGQQAPVYDTGQHAPVYDPPPAVGGGRTPSQPPAAVADDDEPSERPRVLSSSGGYQSEQFAFIEEDSEESEEVIDWLKFSESRTERREEAKRKGRNRKVGLIVLVVMALLGGTGYLWQAGKIPGLNKTKTGAAASSGSSQKRDVIVVHLIPVSGGASATALLVDNATKGRGTTVLIPNSLELTTDDGTATTLDKSVSDGVGPTRDSLNSLLGTDIKGSWRLDSPYLELLVDSLGDVFVDTNATIKGTGADKDKTLVPKGKQQELTGQAAVAYATYKGPGESQTDQLSRFGQVMQAVLKKMPSDAADATKDIQALSQILDPSLTDAQLGASLAQLANLAKTGAYDTAMLPVQTDGMLSAESTDSVVKDILGGTVNASSATAPARVQIKDATGNSKAAPMAQAAIVNGGTYTYVAGGTADSTQATSQVIYSDPARLDAAKDVATTLGLPASEVKKGTVPSNADISVVLGKDYKVPTQ